MPPKRSIKHKQKKKTSKTITCSVCVVTVPKSEIVECDRCDEPCCIDCSTVQFDGKVCCACSFTVECECDAHWDTGIEDLDDEYRGFETECVRCDKTVCMSCLSRCEDCGTDDICMDCTTDCGACYKSVCYDCGDFCEGCDEIRCQSGEGENDHDLNYYSKPLVMEDPKNKGRFTKTKRHSNCMTCRDKYAFIGFDEFKRREKAERVKRQYTLLLIKSRFNETHRKISVKKPDNTEGGTKQALNGELALFVIGSDDMWRVIAEFL